MELLLGFVLGVASSVLATLLLGWVTTVFPHAERRELIAFCQNPLLHLRLRRDTDERAVADRIRALFAAWEAQDVDAYERCWAPDAIRLIGPASTQSQTVPQIKEQFTASCQRYLTIRVSSLVFHDIRIGSGPMAMAEVSYRFNLTRRDSQLPVIEDSREVYSVRRIVDGWQIAANIDHFYEIGPPSERA